ncbi:uncharacterized protein TRAVEDRAFT_52566 [Trametes versicolor FP-101664 SS1]|uniref:uncharacterized protein n=1 Tax=Trametes versicolor (strain FP-101664) TaxID=717944 RepID=UPI0004621E65|nr:uncharacterized protein TRAVEDRAFT_52566 [Trametes versicolor FP-101664 SS1]EIW53436.1 hypothetical protein TRAVEDRAFT_52566 [Trametes versicolor FP-101664 SS1]
MGLSAQSVQTSDFFIDPASIIHASSPTTSFLSSYDTMVQLRILAAFSAYAILLASQVTIAAPARRQLGDLQCNIDRAEIIFNVGQLAGTVANLGNATGLVSANSTADADVTALQTGVQGVGGAVKQILTALVSGENAPPELRTQLGANLTQIRLALADLSSNHTMTAALLDTANTQFTNANLAATGVVTNCK